MRGRDLERGLCPLPRKKLYKGSVVRVSASYRPSSKVVGCEGGIWGGACVPSPGKKYFLYTGSVVKVSASSSFIAVSRLSAHPQCLGPTSVIFKRLTLR